MARLPDTIRVGYLDYTIEAWSAAHATTADRIGECDRQNSIIRVRDDLPPQKTAEVLLHEVLHAAYDMGCVGGEDEEKTVSIFGRQLTQIWRDNPQFVAFMESTFRS